MSCPAFVVYATPVLGSLGQLAGSFTSLMQVALDSDPFNATWRMGARSSCVLFHADVCADPHTSCPSFQVEGFQPGKFPPDMTKRQTLRWVRVFNSLDTTFRSVVLLQPPSSLKVPSHLLLLQAVGASERVFELLDRATLMEQRGGGQKPAGAAEGGHVQLLNVWCALHMCNESSSLHEQSTQKSKNF